MNNFEDAYKTAQTMMDRLIHDSELTEQDTKHCIATLLHAIAVMTEILRKKQEFAKRHPILSKLSASEGYSLSVMATITSAYSAMAQSEINSYTAKYGAFLDVNSEFETS